MVSGVLGGLGAYFDTDSTIFRLLYVLLLLATGIVPGIIVYLAALVIIPEEPRITPSRPVGEAPTDDSAAV
jgi:phage shock protein C